jgi:pimeloyl-ACP methyl ester carboxylesterase
VARTLCAPQKDLLPTMTTATTSVGNRMQLRDGRWLGYSEYGDPMGTPIISLHGNPGSRLTHYPDDAVARAMGARIIALDRPGYGLSTFQRGRRLVDLADDVAALADALGVARFAVMGGSGGGPYAAACAWRLPARVTRLALLSSVAPLDVPGATAGMSRQNRRSFWAARHLPWPLLRAAYALQARLIVRDPALLIEQLSRVLPEPDLAALARPDVHAMTSASVREAFRQGGRGMAWDSVLLARPWGFALGEIAVPAALWHGERDVLAPIAMGRYLARAIPGCRATFLPGEGHLLLYAHWPEVLTWLLGRDVPAAS